MNKLFTAPEQTAGTIWNCSFDIGKKNFAFYIEEINPTFLQSIKNIPKNTRYNEDGTPTKNMEKILQQISGAGKTILFKNLDLTYNCDKKSYLDPETFHNMIDVLDQHSDYFDKCCSFVIEKQMNFAGKRNPMAMKLGQHCYSYFTFRYGRFKQIFEFPAYHKTQVLGAQKIKGKQYKNGNFKWKTIDQRSRKKWTVVKASEILTQRGEEHILTDLKTARKKDDLADVLCQNIAFIYLHYIDNYT